MAPQPTMAILAMVCSPSLEEPAGATHAVACGNHRKMRAWPERTRRSGRRPGLRFALAEPYDMTAGRASRPAAPEVLERWRTAAGAELLIRPVGADDAARELRFLQSLSPQTRYERAFSHRGLLPGELRRLVRFDIRREIGLLVAAGDKPQEEIVAVARLKKSADGSECEFAIVVGDRWQRQGIGERLLQRLL